MTQGSTWKQHLVRAGSHEWSDDHPPTEPGEHRKHIEPWLAALLQAEHLNLLIGSGLTLAVASYAGVSGPDMRMCSFQCGMADAVEKAAKENADRCHRGEPNIEDQIRAILELIGGLRILAKGEGEGESDKFLPKSLVSRLLGEWETALDSVLSEFLKRVIKAEQEIRAIVESDSHEGKQALYLLGSFLLTFASRAASRERLHIFTTNYDRLIEYGCDLLGLRLLDRFVGQLSPVFRSSRLGIDLHYNPPGIRGEPRYLEGVVRLTKLHGSIDWRRELGPQGYYEIRRYGIPFGASEADRLLPVRPGENVIIYPNPAKDVETLEYPYADLFRDFAAAICQPNTVVVTYGYGFGDEHINRIIRDMLTIPSTHLVIISYNDAGGRVRVFCEAVGHREQITLLIGSHFGDLGKLVEHYLPKPAIDRNTLRMVELLNRRTPHKGENDDGEQKKGYIGVPFEEV